MNMYPELNVIMTLEINDDKTEITINCKGTEKVSDKYIPIILLPVGIILAMLLVGFTANGFIQGVLVTGVAVYANQLVKQALKEE